MNFMNLILRFEEKGRGIFNKYKTVLIWTFIFTALTHIYFFVGRFANEDMLGYLSKAPAELGLGRYFYGTSEFFILPVVIFLIVFIEVALTVILLLELFNIKDKIFGIIIAAFVVTFPSWSYSFVYAFLWDTYSLALLTAVLGVYCTNKRKYGFIIGAFFAACSLALYQSYIAVSMTLSLIILICELYDKDIKSVIIKALKLAAFGIAGFILYRIGIWAFGIEFRAYKGVDSMGRIPLNMLPELIKRTYESFVRFFIGNNFGLKEVRFFYVPLFITVVYMADMIFSVVMLKLNSDKKVKWANKIFIAVILLLSPLAIDFIDFVGAETSASNLNSYAFVFVLILPVILFLKYKNKVILTGKNAGGGQFMVFCTSPEGFSLY